MSITVFSNEQNLENHDQVHESSLVTMAIAIAIVNYYIAACMSRLASYIDYL